MRRTKLLQQIAKLDEQVSLMGQELGRKDQVGLSPMIK